MDDPKPILVKDGEIPLPPNEMWEDLDNAAELPVAPARPAATKTVATLDFTGGKPWERHVPLDFPFVWEGREIATITVRRLTTAEMGAIVERHGADFDQWDIFAVMTGLPAAVLRGLESGDGDAVTEVAYDFLPRSLKKGG